MPQDFDFSSIYTEYVDRIYRFVFVRVNSKEIAQDLTADVFTKAFEYFRRNRDAEVKNMQALLYRMASNTVTDHYRQKSRQDISLDIPDVGHAVEFVVAKNEHPDSAVAFGEELASITVALAEMDGEHADIVAWHYVEDLSIKEISEITGRPEGTIRVMLHRGLRNLRRKIQNT
jgi:RNA polymerase sigma-70 factor, ECF subfamily